MQDFHNLKVWQKGHELTLAVYRVTRSFPKEEMYGLTSQLRRASASIPENISEGSCRTEQEFLHFLQIALGSASEVEYELLLAHDLGYIQEQDYQHLHELTAHIKQMLGVFIRTIKTSKAVREPDCSYG